MESGEHLDRCTSLVQRGLQECLRPQIHVLSNFYREQVASGKTPTEAHRELVTKFGRFPARVDPYACDECGELYSSRNWGNQSVKQEPRANSRSDVVCNDGAWLQEFCSGSDKQNECEKCKDQGARSVEAVISRKAANSVEKLLKHAETLLWDDILEKKVKSFDMESASPDSITEMRERLRSLAQKSDSVIDSTWIIEGEIVKKPAVIPRGAQSLKSILDCQEAVASDLLSVAIARPESGMETLRTLQALKKENISEFSATINEQGGLDKSAVVAAAAGLEFQKFLSSRSSTAAADIGEDDAEVLLLFLPKKYASSIPASFEEWDVDLLSQVVLSLLNLREPVENKSVMPRPAFITAVLSFRLWRSAIMGSVDTANMSWMELEVLMGAAVNVLAAIESGDLEAQARALRQECFQRLLAPALQGSVLPEWMLEDAMSRVLLGYVYEQQRQSPLPESLVRVLVDLIQSGEVHHLMQLVQMIGLLREQDNLQKNRELRGLSDAEVREYTSKNGGWAKQIWCVEDVVGSLGDCGIRYAPLDDACHTPRKELEFVLTKMVRVLEDFAAPLVAKAIGHKRTQLRLPKIVKAMRKADALFAGLDHEELAARASELSDISSLVLNPSILRQLCGWCLHVLEVVAEAAGQTVKFGTHVLTGIRTRQLLVEKGHPLSETSIYPPLGELVQECEGGAGARVHPCFFGGIKGSPAMVKVLAVPDEAKDGFSDYILRNVCLATHDNLPQVYGAFHSAEGMCVVVQKVDCPLTLRDLLAKTALYQRSLSWGTRYRIAVNVARGLLHLHRAGLVHARVSSANVLVSSELEVKLAGFGSYFSKPYVDDASDTAFVSPEVSDGKKPTSSSDVFAFGMLLYELITLQTAWEGENVEAMAQHIKSSEKPALQVKHTGRSQAPLVQLMEECMNFDVEVRPQISDVVDRLAQALVQLPQESDFSVSLDDDVFTGRYQRKYLNQLDRDLLLSKGPLSRKAVGHMFGKVRQWYGEVCSGVDDPLMIMGDCLLLHLLNDPLYGRGKQASFSGNGTLLQVLYLFDKVLKEAANGSRSIRVVFFQALEHLFTSPFLMYARQVIIDRIGRHSDYGLDMYQCWWSTQWLEHLSVCRPSCLLLGIPTSHCGTEMLQRMLLDLLAERVPCVDFYQADLRPQGASGLVFFLPPKFRRVVREAKPLPSDKLPSLPPFWVVPPNNSLLKELSHSAAGTAGSSRLLLTAYACTRILAGSDSVIQTLPLVKLILIQSFILDSITLEQRNKILGEDDEEIPDLCDFISSIFAFAAPALRSAAFQSILFTLSGNGPQQHATTDGSIPVADLLDERVVFKLGKLLLEQGGGGEELGVTAGQLKSLENVYASVVKFSGIGGAPALLPVFASTEEPNPLEEHVVRKGTPREPFAVKFSNEFIEKVLEPTNPVFGDSKLTCIPTAVKAVHEEFKLGMLLPDEADVHGPHEDDADEDEKADESEPNSSLQKPQTQVSSTALVQQREELDYMLREASSQKGPTASSKQLWFMLSNTVQHLPKEKEWQALTIPLFLQLLSWSVQPESLATVDGQKRLEAICDGASKLTCPIPESLQTRVAAARKLCAGFRRERARQAFYDKIHKHAASLKPARVVLRDIVVKKETDVKGGDGSSSLLGEDETKLNKNKLESMYKLKFKQLQEEAGAQPNAAAKAIYLWKAIEHPLAEADESLKKIMVPCLQQLLIWATDQQAVKAKGGLLLVKNVCSGLQLAFQPGAQKAAKKAKQSEKPGKTKAAQLQPPAFPAKTDLAKRYKDAQVYIGQYDKMIEAHTVTAAACIAQAEAFERLSDKISRLDDGLVKHSLDFTRDECDHVAVPAHMQLLQWCVMEWQRSRGQSKRVRIPHAVRVFHVSMDTFRRLKLHLSAENLCLILAALGKLGFSDFKSAVEPNIVSDFVRARESSSEPVSEEDIQEAMLKKASDPREAGDEQESDEESSEEEDEERNDESDPGLMIPYNVFQLEYAGHLLVRDVQSKPDPRVSFYPDGWQVRLLDVVDQKRSALVVAPTSSGKTFISYYCIKQVLSENASVSDSEKGIVVYVAPTTALMTQVAAEIYGKCGPVFGIWNEDVSHNVDKCQVLITSPVYLDIILLSPKWVDMVSRMKYAILDEVHYLGLQDGEIWERCFLGLPCPFLALSATLGNKEDLLAWLNRVFETKQERSLPLTTIDLKPVANSHGAEGATTEADPGTQSEASTTEQPVEKEPSTAAGKKVKKGKKEKVSKAPPGGWQTKKGGGGKGKNDKQKNSKAPSTAEPSAATNDSAEAGTDTQAPRKGAHAELIYHSERWSHLNKFMYIPGKSKLLNVHPFHALKIRYGSMASRTFPVAMELSSSECLQLHEAMMDDDVLKSLPAATASRVQALQPTTFFSDAPFMTKNDVSKYASALKTELQQWCEQGNGLEADFVTEILGRRVDPEIAAMENQASKQGLQSCYSPDFLKRHFVDLLTLLRQLGSLPALVFTLNQTTCEELAAHAVMFLEEQEKETRTREYDEGETRRRREEITSLESQISKLESAIKKLKRPDQQKLIKLQELKDSLRALEELEKPGVDQRFSLRPALEYDDVWEWQEKMRKRLGWDERNIWVRCLARGIGLHHEGMPASYKSWVEVAFRRGHLKVVVSTQTLATGINMPCRATVFAGSPSWLTPLQFQQSSGRAGRRGHDYEGQTIFFGLPRRKIALLLTASLPSLPSLFFYDTNVALRVAGLHHSVRSSCSAEDKRLKSVECSIDSLLHQPLLTLPTLSSNSKFPVCQSQPSDSATATTNDKAADSVEGAEETRKASEGAKVMEMLMNKQSLSYFRNALSFLAWSGLVDKDLSPNGFAGVVGRLNSHGADQAGVLVLAELLSRGELQTICKNFRKSTADSIAKELLEVLCHLFERVPLHPDFTSPDRGSPSQVFLKELKEPFSDAVTAVNRRSRAAYLNYAHSLVRLQHLASTSPAIVFPLSDSSLGSLSSAKEASRGWCGVLGKMIGAVPSTSTDTVEAGASITDLSIISPFACLSAKSARVLCAVPSEEELVVRQTGEELDEVNEDRADMMSGVEEEGEDEDDGWDAEQVASGGNGAWDSGDDDEAPVNWDDEDKVDVEDEDEDLGNWDDTTDEEEDQEEAEGSAYDANGADGANVTDTETTRGGRARVDSEMRRTRESSIMLSADAWSSSEVINLLREPPAPLFAITKDTFPCLETHSGLAIVGKEGKELAVSCLNSYALDFYRHHSLQAIIDINGLPSHEARARLKKWTILLNQITKALKCLSEAKHPGKRNKTVQAFAYLANTFTAKYNLLNK